jgi:transposase-like protein
MGYPATWTPEDRERGLTALVLAGSSTIAEKECGIPATNLRDWKSKYRDEYDRLAKDLEPKVVDKIAAEAESMALRIAEREAEIIRRLTDQKIDDLNGKDMASALKNLSTAKALQIDKLSSPLRERPSHVQQGNDMEGLLIRMARAMGIQQPTQVPNEAVLVGSAVTLSTESDQLKPREAGPEHTELDTPPSPT